MSIRPADVARGDVIWLPMAPTKGHEQAGDRPHLVLSDRVQHRVMGVAITVPMTSTRRPWPTRVEIGSGSYAICEQPRTVAFERVRRHDATGHDTSKVLSALWALLT